MPTVIEAFELLEDNLKNLLSKYLSLVKENQQLLKDTSKLKHELLEKEQLLEQRQKEF